MVEQRVNKATLLILALIVALGAASYFSLTYYRTINPEDEGYLLYNFEKTAEGQIPHRDFYDDYGPAIYWLGGSLFKLFGTKLIVIRIFILALKTAMTLLVFLIARKILPPAFALLAAAFFIVSWGDPYFPAFNILYAGFVSHFLALLGIFFMITYIERENRLWLAGTAVCLGMSALFKFHSAVFDFIGFSVFLSLKEGAVGLGAAASPPMNEVAGTAQSRLLRAGKLLGAPAVGVFYLVLFARERLDLYYFFIFLLAYFLLLGFILAMDVRLMYAGATHTLQNLKRCYFEIFTLMGGVLVFVFLALVYYYRAGGLEELMYDTLELPLAMSFFKPMEDYRLHAGLIAGAVVAIFALALLVDRLREHRQALLEPFWAICLLAVLLLPAVYLLMGKPVAVWRSRTVFLLTPITLMLSSTVLVYRCRKEQLAGSPGHDTLVLGLLTIFACQGYIFAFPRTDPTHVQTNSTVVFILVSFVLWMIYARWADSPEKRERIRGAILAGACAVVLFAPFLWSMKEFFVFSPNLPEHLKEKLPASVRNELDVGAITSYPELEFDFPRSYGLRVSLWPESPHHTFVLCHTAGVIRFLNQHTEFDEPVFVLSGSQMIYFLAERNNPVRKENYFTYLAAVELIDKADVVPLRDEELMQLLVRERPRFIVKVIEEYGDQTKKLYRIWPKTGEYIDRNYQWVTNIGVYAIMQPRSPGKEGAEPGLRGQGETRDVKSQGAG